MHLWVGSTDLHIYLHSHIVITKITISNRYPAGTLCGLIYLRIKRPDMTRPIKTPLALPVAMLVYVIMLIILTGRLVVSDEMVGVFHSSDTDADINPLFQCIRSSGTA